MNTIKIELVYALPEEQKIYTLVVPENCTVGEAIQQSPIWQRFPELHSLTFKVGIFSKQVTLNQSLRDKDRIEIYRPLIADPKEVRRKKALEQNAKD